MHVCVLLSTSKEKKILHISQLAKFKFMYYFVRVSIFLTEPAVYKMYVSQTCQNMYYLKKLCITKSIWFKIISDVKINRMSEHFYY